MRLVSLRMRNFRQHADTRIQFRPGLTGIIGPNGAGKSTILEGIAWAIYGAPAARGTNDTIRFARAAPRTRVEVELEFELGAHLFRVARSMNNADVWLDNGSTPVATTLAGVSSYLQTRVGMTREEFFNTYFTGQKELAFLAAMGPAERGRFLSQVLGYERLRRAQDLVKARRTELRAEIRGLQSALGDPEELASRITMARSRLDESAAALVQADEQTGLAAREAAAVLPRWEAAQQARDRHRDLTHALDAAEKERESARRDVERARLELEAVEKAEAELAPLREQLALLPELSAECERLAEQAQKEERRKALAAQLAELQQELERVRENVKRTESAPALEKKFAAELEKLAAERAQIETEVEQKRAAWLTDRQDAFTKLQNYRDRGRELKEQIVQIETLGPEGTCPTCGRPVGADYERLLDELNDQWVTLVQDGKWWASRYEQIENKPADVAELEEREKTLAAQVDDRARKHTRCQTAVQELERFRADAARAGRRHDEITAELGTLPEGYDREHHRQAEHALRHLRGLEKQGARLEEAVGRRAHWEKERDASAAREAGAVKAQRAAARERGALGFSEADFAAARAEHEGAVKRHREAELHATELRGVVATARQGLVQAERELAEFQERDRELSRQKADLALHDELDRAYTELRTELNDRVRPELSEIGSVFLAQLTDGRYTGMDIDDSYNLMVLDEGEDKPVISGGEEDVANLVLRLSLSQMIAERAGHPLSLLILDEVFGSLDVARRDNVVSLLHNLEDRFEQVILITHVEGIRESLDQVLRVEYDERTGTSLVREENVTGGPEDLPEAPMAAD